MKTPIAKRLSIVAALVLLALAFPTKAMPPIPHMIKGGVERIDASERKLVITNDHDRVVLTWKQGAAAYGCCLNPGDPLKAYYRKAAGRYVISDLRVLSPIGCK